MVGLCHPDAKPALTHLVQGTAGPPRASAQSVSMCALRQVWRFQQMGLDDHPQRKHRCRLLICLLCFSAASEDEAVPFSSPSKRPAVGGNAPPPPPPPRGADAAQRERKPPRSASHERSGRSASLVRMPSLRLLSFFEANGGHPLKHDMPSSR